MSSSSEFAYNNKKKKGKIVNIDFVPTLKLFKYKKHARRREKKGKRKEKKKKNQNILPFHM